MKPLKYYSRLGLLGGVIWLVRIAMSSSNNSQVWMVEGFVQHSQGWTRRSMGVPVDFLSSTPSDGANSSGGGSSSNDYLLQSLRARQLELDQSEQMLANRFRQAECVGNIAAALPDWVRRIDVCYPLLAAGSASGNIYIAHLERQGKIVASSVQNKANARAKLLRDDEEEEDDNQDEEDDVPSSSATTASTTKTRVNFFNSKTFAGQLDSTLRLLHGSFDGGGTLAIAFEGTLICEAGRMGGVKLWRLDPSSEQLVSQGTIPALDGKIVTALYLDESSLWVATAEGRLQHFMIDSENPLALQTKAYQDWNVKSTIVSMHIDVVLGCAVVSTASGHVHVISIEETEDTRMTFLPPYDSSAERRSSLPYSMSCSLVSHTKEKNSCSLVCGANDGRLYVHTLSLDADGQVNFVKQSNNNPPMRSLVPRHMAGVKCLASPIPGLLISAGQDSTMKVWDIDEQRFLYQFVGYKVWIGSLWTDGKRILSDGADNTIVMHDFTRSKNKTSD